MDEKFFRRFQSFENSLAALEEVKDRDLVNTHIYSAQAESLADEAVRK